MIYRSDNYNELYNMFIKLGIQNFKRKISLLDFEMTNEHQINSKTYNVNLV